MKKSRAVTIFNVLSQEGEFIDLQDDLSDKLDQEFDTDLGESLEKFFDSYVTQTRSDIIEVDYFVFNLISAANRGKFGMRETVFG